MEDKDFGEMDEKIMVNFRMQSISIINLFVTPIIRYWQTRSSLPSSLLQNNSHLNDFPTLLFPYLPESRRLRQPSPMDKTTSLGDFPPISVQIQPEQTNIRDGAKDWCNIEHVINMSKGADRALSLQ